MAAYSSSIVMAFCLFVMVVAMSFWGVEGSGNHGLSWVRTTTPFSGRCRGSIAECMAENAEYGMDSESNRRILATSKYISYGALQRNTVPCSHRGASYYNCQEGAAANPYNRDCSTITRCRS